MEDCWHSPQMTDGLARQFWGCGLDQTHRENRHAKASFSYLVRAVEGCVAVCLKGQFTQNRNSTHFFTTWIRAFSQAIGADKLHLLLSVDGDRSNKPWHGYKKFVGVEFGNQTSSRPAIHILEVDARESVFFLKNILISSLADTYLMTLLPPAMSPHFKEKPEPWHRHHGKHEFGRYGMNVFIT